AGGARAGLDLAEGLIADVLVGGVVDRVDQVQVGLGHAVGHDRLPGLHRPAGDEHGGHVQPHGGIQHAGGDLVAVGDAYQRIGAVSIDHVLHRVRDQVPAGQGVQHAVVAHGDAVVDGDGVELLGHSPGLTHRTGDEVPHVLQVHVPRYELGIGVGDRHDRFTEIVRPHAGGAPEGAGAG